MKPQTSSFRPRGAILALSFGLAILLLAGTAQAQPNVVDPEWELVRTIQASGVISARWNPVTTPALELAPGNATVSR